MKKIKWRHQTSIVKSDRNIALRNTPNTKPVEERKNIVSNRPTVREHGTHSAHRLESKLEADAMEIFMARQDVVAVRTQVGPFEYRRDGVIHRHYADLCVTFANGCCVLYAVRHSSMCSDLKLELEHIRNHGLKNRAHFIKLLTENDISKPRVYRAREILRARNLNDETCNELVLQTLHNLGGRATVHDVVSRLPESFTYSDGWTAIWSMIDRGLFIHDHPQADSTPLNRTSWVRLIKEH
ncbi:hypothetical protein IB276_05715 [Ensifer sp. ENS04]|uniref:hypothetical protein n=1 Tax=Ensifer sp. ENS04 TaxID=2769281 RepID=UPI00177C7999|nr:hypothetical protein [Ensifer sp. ENS04]MBD9538937.1 hypothetical protein [Ensifer sp. ENS04]